MPHDHHDRHEMWHLHFAPEWLSRAIGQYVHPPHSGRHLPHLAPRVKRMGYAWAASVLAVAGWILMTLITGILTRNLSTDDFGMYSSAIAVASLTIMFSTLGLEKLAVKVIPFFRSRKELGYWKGFLMFGAMWSIVFGLFASLIALGIWTLLLHRDDGAGVLFFHLMFFLPAIALFMFLYEICSAYDINLRSATVYRLLVPSCMLGLLWILIESYGGELDDSHAVMAYGGGWILGLIILIIWTVRTTPSEVFKSPVQARTGGWLLGGIGFLGFSLSMMLTSTSAILALSILDSETAAGQMGAITQVTTLLIICMTAVTRLFTPRLSAAIADGKSGPVRRIRRQMFFTMIPLVAAFLAVCVTMGEDILSFFGKGYEDMSTALLISASAIALQSLVYLVPWELQFRDQQRIVLLCSLLGAFLGVVAISILSWLYGVPGAAGGQIILTVLVFLPMTIVLWRMGRA